MKHPSYHLRLNKAVDRFLLVETLRRLRDSFGLEDYTYYGLGGPFLEDCRLLYEYCPEIELVSIERDDDTFERQKFHRFTSKLKLIKSDFGDFLAEFQPKKKDRQIFWLDYVDAEPKRMGEFMDVLCKVADRSIIRITLKAEFSDNPFLQENATNEMKDLFLRKINACYSEWFPPFLDETILGRPVNTVKLIQDMIQIQAERALPPAAEGRLFQPLCTSYYNDSTDMLSVTGIVCTKGNLPDIQKCFNGWQFANLEWKQPYEIKTPVLSVKERLLLEAHLPLINGRTGRSLARKIKYSVIREGENWEKTLEEYAAICKYCPSFAKIVV